MTYSALLRTECETPTQVCAVAGVGASHLAGCQLSRTQSIIKVPVSTARDKFASDGIRTKSMSPVYSKFSNQQGLCLSNSPCQLNVQDQQLSAGNAAFELSSSSRLREVMAVDKKSTSGWLTSGRLLSALAVHLFSLHTYLSCDSQSFCVPV